MAENQLKALKFFYSTENITEDSLLVYFYHVTALPYSIVVGKHGKIMYADLSTKLPLASQDFIDQLLAGGGLLQQPEAQDDQPLTELSLAKQVEGAAVKRLKAKFRELVGAGDALSKEIGKMGYAPKLEISFRKFRRAEAESSVLAREGRYGCLRIECEVREKDYAVLEQTVLQPVFSAVPREQFLFKLKLLKTVDIPLGHSCAKCKQELGAQVPHYWCRSLNEHLCVRCAEEESPDKPGLERYSYPHNLVFIDIKGNVGMLCGIDEYKLGKDRQPQRGERIPKQANYCCNLGCGQPTSLTRYVCLNCRPGTYDNCGFNDFCASCESAFRNKAHEQHEKVRQKCSQMKHSEDHLRLRILFSTEGYLDY